MAAAAPPPTRPRVMVLPFPAQGHVMPLMELAHRLVEHGIEVDFVNTDFNHDRVVKAMEGGGEAGPAVPAAAGINMVSLPDGMGPDGDRTDIGKLSGGLPAAMLGRILEMVVSKKIRWVVADVSMSWVMDLVAKAGVRVALFSTFAAAIFALRMHVPKMIEDGIFDEFGNVTRNERIQLSPKMPATDATKLPWTCLRKSPESHRKLIQIVIKTNPKIALAETIVCNTFAGIESEALALLPKPALAVGPLEVPASTSAACHFWPEDRTCLTWLNAQAPGSVVYVAFGSLTVFDATRLQELADGLVLTGRPFLWVVRPNFADGVGDDWLDEFKRRIGDAGLGAAAACALAPLSGVLRDSLRLELDHGRGAARRAVPVLALLRRPVLQPELHLRRVGYGLEDLRRRAGRRHQGGDQGQGHEAALGRRDQSEGNVLEEGGMCKCSQWRVLASRFAQACESIERTIIFSIVRFFLYVERSGQLVGYSTLQIRSVKSWIDSHI